MLSHQSSYDKEEVSPRALDRGIMSSNEEKMEGGLENALSLRWVSIEVYVGKLERKGCCRSSKKEEGYALLEEEDGLKRAVEATSGRLEPGEMCCLMGPSGSGKTTLLSVLAGRPQLGADGYWTGEILLNGAKPWKRWRRELAYVLQRDIFFESLTVEEELTFAAELRSVDARGVAQIAEMMGLESVMKSKIGSSVERGLSGGETKRLNIAVELLSAPRLALLDEPLTGLDSSRAFGILRTLRESAKAGTGVLLSVHMPNSKLWALFDRVLLFAKGGRVVYDGSAVDAAKYFERKGFPLPQDWNPPDHFIEVISGTDVDRLVSEWKRPANSADDPAESSLSEDGEQRKPPPLAPFLTQVKTLTSRSLANAKGTFLKPLDWILVLSLACIWGFLWYGAARSAKRRGKHASDIVSICFFFVAQWSWGPSFQQIGAFPSERDVLAKELASESYSIEAWFISKQIAEIPISALLPAVFYLVCWPLVGLPLLALPGAYAATLLESWVAASLAQCLSALLMDIEQTTTVIIVLQVFMMCCAGFFIDMTKQPASISWVKYTSYWYYACGLFLKIIALPFDDKSKLIHEEIRDYSFSELSTQGDCVVLFLFGVVFRIGAYVALKTSKKLRFS